jgi:hypothetical protein
MSVPDGPWMVKDGPDGGSVTSTGSYGNGHPYNIVPYTWKSGQVGPSYSA